MAASTTVSQHQPAACPAVRVEHPLTRGEVKDLNRSASSPADHLRLAAYFREQALIEQQCGKVSGNVDKAVRNSLKAAGQHERIAQAMLEGAPFGTRHNR